MFSNEGFSKGLKLPRQRKTETKQIASKRRRDTSQNGFYCRTGCSNTDRTCQTCGAPGVSAACRKPTTPRRKAQVCNNQGFRRRQELSDPPGFQPSRRTTGLGTDGWVSYFNNEGFLILIKKIISYFNTQTSHPKTIYCWNTVKIEDPPTQ